VLEFSKKILSKVSFDKQLFRKELHKCANWLKNQEAISLKIWALSTFSQHRRLILDVFDKIS
tara:strand:- start:1198 stop:1383 length:186 start_codon:yes stop_codon:yes gene_type:complete